MTRRWGWLAAAAVGFGVVGCDVVGVSGAIRVRLENQSNLRMDQVWLYPGGPDTVVATLLDPGERTEYQRLSFGYATAGVAVTFGADTVSLFVIDHVGDRPLVGGNYTYLIGVEEVGGRKRLTETFRRD